MTAPPLTRHNPLLFNAERLEQKIDPNPPAYTGTPELRGPFGVVYLPSPELDRISPRWLNWTRENRHASISVNLAFLSKRLRDADAQPGHNVWLDFPRKYAKVTAKFEDFIIPFQFNETVKVWGAYHDFYRNEYIGQLKHAMPDGQQVPVWCDEERMTPDDDKLRIVAGQYTSCAACNIMAHVLGWNCTILVVGGMGHRGYCDLSIAMKPEWLALTQGSSEEEWINGQARTRPQTHAANNQQWAALRLQAKATQTEIVHVGGPTTSIPNITEEAALTALGA